MSGTDGERAAGSRDLRVPRILETERLTGQAVRASHLSFYREIYGDSRIMKTLGGDTLSPEGARARLNVHLRDWDEAGLGIWVFREKAGCVLVGRGGLRRVNVSGRPEVEVLYAIRPELWGRGLATEVARRSAEVGVDEAGLKRVVAFTLISNRASRRVLEKAGFRYAGRVEHRGLAHLLFRRSHGGPAGSFHEAHRGPVSRQAMRPEADPPGDGNR